MSSDYGDIRKRILQAGLLKDPQWLDRLDEPAPLGVVLDTLLQLIERMEPPGQPYD